jgi:hypothetical protein
MTSFDQSTNDNTADPPAGARAGVAPVPRQCFMTLWLPPNRPGRFFEEQNDGCGCFAFLKNSMHDRPTG